MEKLLPLASARLVTTVNVTGALEDNPISMYTKRKKNNFQKWMALSIKINCSVNRIKLSLRIA